MSGLSRPGRPIECRRYPSSGTSVGGFILHYVTLAGSVGRFSCWYDKDGKLLDADQYRPSRAADVSAYPVKRGGPIWRALEALGPAWKEAK